MRNSTLNIAGPSPRSFAICNRPLNADCDARRHAHLIGNSASLLATKLAAIAFGLSGGLALANLYISAFDVVPADTRSSAVAFVNFAGYLASGFAPVFTGLWKQSIGIHRMLSYSSLLLVAAAVVLLAGIKFLFPSDYQRVH